MVESLVVHIALHAVLHSLRRIHLDSHTVAGHIEDTPDGHHTLDLADTHLVDSTAAVDTEDNSLGPQGQTCLPAVETLAPAQTKC